MRATRRVCKIARKLISWCPLSPQALPRCPILPQGFVGLVLLGAPGARHGDRGSGEPRKPVTLRRQDCIATLHDAPILRRITPDAPRHAACYLVETVTSRRSTTDDSPHGFFGPSAPAPEWSFSTVSRRRSDAISSIVFRHRFSASFSRRHSRNSPSDSCHSSVFRSGFPPFSILGVFQIASREPPPPRSESPRPRGVSPRGGSRDSRRAATRDWH